MAKEGFTIALAARQIDKLKALSDEIGAVSFTADASQLDEVEQLFTDVEQKLGVPSFDRRSKFIELDQGTGVEIKQVEG